MLLCIQVALALLASVTSSSVPTTVKTVQQGATVNEPVLNVSALGEHDQLMVYYGRDSTELSAQYFCENGTCENRPASVCQFQVYSGDVCLIIPNVNVSNSGEYSVVLNGHTGIRNLNLTVEAVPQHSHSTFPLVPVIVGSAVAVLFLVIVIFLVIHLNYKKPGAQRQGRLRYNFLTLSIKCNDAHPDHSHQGPQLQDAQGNV